MSKLQTTINAIAPLDEGAMAAARERQDQLTKPRGSLGQLEDISVHIAGIMGDPRPIIKDKVVITVAGDHGIVVEGVSLYPQEVTAQMVLNFLHGGAAINVLARHVGARVVVVDAGVLSDLPEHPDLRICKIARGTRNFAKGPAMTREQAVQSIEVGIEIVEAEIAKGADVVVPGEMGIGNTTPASAIIATFSGLPVAEVTGRGTGLDDAGLAHKIAVIENALAVNRPNANDALDVLSKVGGFEIGVIAGIVLGAAAHRVAVVLDGFICTAGGLIAAELAPAVKPYLFSAHNSVEIGHRAMLERLELTPMLDLGLRLGEGTGAALALSLVEAATKILNEMATFADAGVADKE